MSTRSASARQNHCRINQSPPRRPRRSRITQSHGHHLSCLQSITSRSLLQTLSAFHKLTDRCSPHPTNPPTTPACHTRTSTPTSNTGTPTLTTKGCPNTSNLCGLTLPHMHTTLTPCHHPISRRRSTFHYTILARMSSTWLWTLTWILDWTHKDDHGLLYLLGSRLLIPLEAHIDTVWILWHLFRAIFRQ